MVNERIPGRQERPVRVLLINNQLSPNRIPVYNALAEIPGIDLEVMLLGGRTGARRWEIDHGAIRFMYRVLWNVTLGGRHNINALHLNLSALPRIIQASPDVIVAEGYDEPTMWLALAYSRIFRKKLVLWTGTTLLSVRRTGGLAGWLKRRFVRAADAHVTYGTKAAEYVEHLGANPAKVVTGVNPSHGGYFRREAEAFRESDEWRRRRDELPPVVILYVGRPERAKGTFLLLQALARFDAGDWALLIVGTGPEEAEARESAKRLGICERVQFEGYVQWDRLPRCYALADVFVLPTLQEAWGLVLNEALACGAYSLGSVQAAASHDLIREPDNGCIFDPRDPRDFSRKLTCAMDLVRAGRLDAEARTRISDSAAWATPQYQAERIAEAVSRAL